jgi:hypothetical protein
MEKLPKLHFMPRVPHDVDELLEFIASKSWGIPHARLRDIKRGIDEVCDRPLRSKVHHVRSDGEVEFRRHDVRQFAIIYAYYEPGGTSPNGMVSIRAVRHRRVEDVFAGVKEPMLVWADAPTGNCSGG